MESQTPAFRRTHLLASILVGLTLAIANPLQAQDATAETVEIHYFRPLAACCVLPVPAGFTLRSAGGRTVCCGGGPISRFVTACWPIVQMLLAVQYSTRPLGAHASMTLKMTGIIIIIFCCTGSVIVAGVIRCWITMLMPMMIGQMKSGSRAERSVIHPTNGAPRISIATDNMA